MNKELIKYIVCKFSKRIEGGLGTCGWILRCIEENAQILAKEFEDSKRRVEKTCSEVEETKKQSDETVSQKETK